MSKVVWIVLFVSSLFGGDEFWSYTYSYQLKKDKEVVVKIKKNYLPTKKSDGVLRFRWTLYKAKQLTLFVKYEDFPSQYILQKRYKRDTLKINLIGDFPTISKQSFAIIKFRDFKNSVAYIDIMIRDPEHRLEVRFK